MNRLAITLIFLGLSLFTLGQKKCDQQKQNDSILLLKFSADLKKAVLTYDMNKIASFFKFPFLNKRCVADDNTNKDSLISRKAFVTSKYGDFFGCWFSETISKGYISYELKVSQEGQGCKFTFNYPACFPSYITRSSCKTHNFFVEKINGRYMITSAWLSN
jgi:hypothetical protein